MKIEELDQNLKVSTDIEGQDLVWFDAKEAPFSLTGVIYDTSESRYLRVPQAVADGISKGVSGGLNHCTAGGKLRFCTDSDYIAIRAKMDHRHGMSHMPLTGQSGFDLYHVVEGRETYYRSFIPPRDMTEGYTSGHKTTGALTDYTINFPLYDKVQELYIGVRRNAALVPPTPYRNEKPIVYYGNSITQGGCASRPGNAYPAMLSRMLSVDHINLGYSGNGKGEPAFARYIATLDMSVLVMDYDANAPSEEALRETHYPFYKIVREAQPTLPIVFISSSGILLRPVVATGDRRVRREIIRESYERARAEGDENVYFIDGAEIFAGDFWDACTVDGGHPNDLGFYHYALRLEKTLRPLLK